MLKPYQVRDVEKLLADGLSQREVNRQTQVARGTIARIASGRRPNYEAAFDDPKDGQLQPLAETEKHRCGTCGGLTVFLECLVCKTLAEKNPEKDAAPSRGGSILGSQNEKPRLHLAGGGGDEPKGRHSGIVRMVMGDKARQVMCGLQRSGIDARPAAEAVREAVHCAKRAGMVRADHADGHRAWLTAIGIVEPLASVLEHLREVDGRYSSSVVPGELERQIEIGLVSGGASPKTRADELVKILAIAATINSVTRDTSKQSRVA